MLILPSQIVETPVLVDVKVPTAELVELKVHATVIEPFTEPRLVLLDNDAVRSTIGIDPLLLLVTNTSGQAPRPMLKPNTAPIAIA